MLSNLKHQHSHILPCMPHSISPVPASPTSKGMKLVHSSLSCVLFWGHILFTPFLLPWEFTLPPGTHLLYFSHPSSYFYEQNPSADFTYFTDATHLSPSPWTQSHPSYPATDATPHILPPKHRSSSSRQFFLTLPASRENRNGTQEYASLGKKTKKPHPPASPTTTNTQQKHYLSHHTLNSLQLPP